MPDKPHIIAVIPARYGSTRLAAKPLIDLCGKPMIRHVYERTKLATLVDDVIVATDHNKIADVVHSFGGKVIMTPTESATGSDRIAWAAGKLSNAAIIVNVQGDEPLIAPQMIDQAIAPMIADASIEVNTLAKRITDPEEVVNPNIVKIALDAASYALYFSRSTIPYLRDEKDTASWVTKHDFIKHFGIYVYRRDVLLKFAGWKESPLERAEKLEQLRFLDNGVRIKVTFTEFDTIPIDTEYDAERVREILQNA